MVELFKTLKGHVNFYFLRHGESEGNSARVIQGRKDFPLSARGLEQAEQTAVWFEDRSVEVILSSTLKRAAQTATEVGRILGVEDIRRIEELQELDTGIFTGLTVPEIQRRYPEAWRSFQLSSWEGVPEAERIAELYGRSERLWKHLAGLCAQGRRNILCVTHSGILQWVIKVTFAQRSWMPLVPMGNCSISQLSLDSDPDGHQPRCYLEWTRLNYQPLGADDREDRLFLER